MTSLLMVLVANTLFLQMITSEGNFTCTPNTYFPHPSDCSLYYHCDDQYIQQLFYCPIGFFFNPQSQACDLPRGGECPVPLNQREEEEEDLGLKTFSVPPTGGQTEGDSGTGGDALTQLQNKDEEGGIGFWNPISPENNDQEPTQISDGSNKFLYAVRNFEKTLEGGEANTDDINEQTTVFPEGLRRKRDDGINSPPLTVEAMIEPETKVDMGFETRGDVAGVEIKSDFESSSTVNTEENTPVEGKCSSDSFGVKSFPAYPIVGVLLGKKEGDDKPMEEGPKVESSGDGEVKSENKPDESSSTTESATTMTSNMTMTTEEPRSAPRPIPDLTKVVLGPPYEEPENATEEEIVHIPQFSFLNPKDILSPLTPFGNDNNDTLGNSHMERIINGRSDTSEGNDKVEEIEEAKSTLIFESHPEPVRDTDAKQDELASVFFGEPARLK